MSTATSTRRWENSVIWKRNDMLLGFPSIVMAAGMPGPVVKKKEQHHDTSGVGVRPYYRKRASRDRKSNDPE